MLRPSPFSHGIGIMCLTIAFCLLACSMPAKIVRESSMPSRPLWIEKPPQGNGMLYFVGIRTAADTLEDGQSSAIKDAMSRISGFLGSRIESVFEDEISDVEQRLKQQISSKSKSDIHGANIVDTYHEKVTRIDRNFKIEKYDVFVLVSFSKEEAEKEMSRQQKEKEDKIHAAFSSYRSGINYEAEKKYISAVESYNSALSLINEVEDVIAVKDDNIRTSEGLRQTVKLHLAYATAQLSKVALLMKINGAERQVFASNLTAELNKMGFTVTDQEPAFEINCEVALSEGGYTLDNYVYYAEGSVSARRTSDGQTVATYPFRVKGFKRTKDQAVLDALKEAGIDAGRNLAKLLPAGLK